MLILAYFLVNNRITRPKNDLLLLIESFLNDSEHHKTNRI